MLSEEKGGKENQESFTPDTSTIFATVALRNLPAGTKFSAVWIAEKTKRASAEQQVARSDVTLKDATTQRDISMSVDKTSDWPRGNYRLDVLVNDKKVGTANFTIE